MVYPYFIIFPNIDIGIFILSEKSGYSQPRWVVTDLRLAAPEHVTGDESVALGFGLFAVDRLRGR